MPRIAVFALAGVLAVARAAAPQTHADGSAASTLEGRPDASHVSPLQARIDAAPAGATVVVPPGRYAGDVFLDKPVRLVGDGRPLLVGSGEGSVVRVRADHVLVEGFDVDGQGGGDLGQDASGIHVAARHVTVRGCRIRNTLFGVYLREADGAVVEHTEVRGIPGRDPGEKGSGIHIWNTTGFRLSHNVMTDVRDGFYIQSSSRGFIDHNRASDLRYGLHYMFSDDNTFEDNTFERGAAGTALMYSRGIVFRRNRFMHNRGFASVGLLFQACEDVLAENNLIADNARGIFLEGTRRAVFRGNVVAGSDMAIMLFDSAAESRFEGNSFVGNMTPLTLVGRRTDTSFDGNYWLENREPDLDGDGRSDRPYRLSSVFDHLRGNLSAADLYVDGFAASAMALAEDTFPVLEAATTMDRHPLARPPALPETPRPESRPAQQRASGIGAFVTLALGAAGWWRGCAPRASRRREERS